MLPVLLLLAGPAAAVEYGAISDLCHKSCAGVDLGTRRVPDGKLCCPKDFCVCNGENEGWAAKCPLASDGVNRMRYCATTRECQEHCVDECSECKKPWNSNCKEFTVGNCPEAGHTLYTTTIPTTAGGPTDWIQACQASALLFNRNTTYFTFDFGIPENNCMFIKDETYIHGCRQVAGPATPALNICQRSPNPCDHFTNEDCTYVALQQQILTDFGASECQDMIGFAQEEGLVSFKPNFFIHDTDPINMCILAEVELGQETTNCRQVTGRADYLISECPAVLKRFL